MRILRNSIFFLSISLVSLGSTSAQIYDISSGGLPTITGSSGGSVTGSSSVQSDLIVTVNFGEVSPANTNNIVKVTVPIGIRSQLPYQVSVTVSGGTNANPQALQFADIGFGVSNFRAMGAQSQVCTNSSHIFYSPFNNDPTTNVLLNGAGRATYMSSLNNIGVSTVILSGPRLTHNSNGTRQTNDGYIFDVILAITPQFYAAGTTSATLVFTILSGPNAPC